MLLTVLLLLQLQLEKQELLLLLLLQLLKLSSAKLALLLQASTCCCMMYADTAVFGEPAGLVLALACCWEHATGSAVLFVACLSALSVDPGLLRCRFGCWRWCWCWGCCCICWRGCCSACCCVYWHCKDAASKLLLFGCCKPCVACNHHKQTVSHCCANSRNCEHLKCTCGKCCAMITHADLRSGRQLLNVNMVLSMAFLLLPPIHWW